MDFHSLSRKELQTLCKKNKIPANMTNVAMADALKALNNIEGIDDNQQGAQPENLSESPEKSEMGSPDLPRTCRRSSRRRPVKDSDQTENESKDLVESSRPLRTRRGTAAKASSAKTEQDQIKADSSVLMENNRLEIPQTPVIRTVRKRATATSVRRKTETLVKEEREKENENTVTVEMGSRVSTRRSMRLLSEKRLPEEVPSIQNKNRGRKEAVKIAALSEESEEETEKEIKDDSEKTDVVDVVLGGEDRDEDVKGDDTGVHAESGEIKATKGYCQLLEIDTGEKGNNYTSADPEMTFKDVTVAIPGEDSVHNRATEESYLPENDTHDGEKSDPDRSVDQDLASEEAASAFSVLGSPLLREKSGQEIEKPIEGDSNEESESLIAKEDLPTGEVTGHIVVSVLESSMETEICDQEIEKSIEGDSNEERLSAEEDLPTIEENINEEDSIEENTDAENKKSNCDESNLDLDTDLDLDLENMINLFPVKLFLEIPVDPSESPKLYFDKNGDPAADVDGVPYSKNVEDLFFGEVSVEFLTEREESANKELLSAANECFVQQSMNPLSGKLISESQKSDEGLKEELKSLDSSLSPDLEEMESEKFGFQMDANNVVTVHIPADSESLSDFDPSLPCENLKMMCEKISSSDAPVATNQDVEGQNPITDEILFPLEMDSATEINDLMISGLGFQADLKRTTELESDSSTVGNEKKRQSLSKIKILTPIRRSKLFDDDKENNCSNSRKSERKEKNMLSMGGRNVEEEVKSPLKHLSLRQLKRRVKEKISGGKTTNIELERRSALQTVNENCLGRET
ncbi:uncharacterized protein LOC143887222 [Tasmannia lanceolata]|uniref:uncharacterized protein LOC143887222 n=1 Tax=Tasmannia lanceolata TaxID=3420 RepID=UPI004063CC21